MPIRRDDWIQEVKQSPEQFCYKEAYGLVPSTRMIIKRFECSQGTAQKLSVIVAKSLEERKQLNQSGAEKPVL